MPITAGYRCTGQVGVVAKSTVPTPSPNCGLTGFYAGIVRGFHLTDCADSMLTLLLPFCFH